MTKPQLIALIAGALHGSRTQTYGDEDAIRADVETAERIWLEAVRQDK